MRFVGRWLWRLILALVIFVVLLLSPVAYTELACTGEVIADDYQPIITQSDWQRAESRTPMMTMQKSLKLVIRTTLNSCARLLVFGNRFAL